MSDFDTGDTGHEPGTDVDYGQYDAGHEQDSLDQLHHDGSAEADANSQYGVYEQDHHSAEATELAQGHHQSYESGTGVHAESDDFTNFSHNANVDDHVFAAEGSENQHVASFDNLDELQHRFEGDFAEGTRFHQEGGEAGLGVASN